MGLFDFFSGSAQKKKGAKEEKRQSEGGNPSKGATNASNFDDLIFKLKSSDSTERRNAAKTLGVNREKRALRPLFEALMNWNEEEENVEVISIALFKNLWVDLDHTLQKSILNALAPGSDYLYFRALMDKVVSVQILGAKDINERLNPGQSERVSTMLRYALKDNSVWHFMHGISVTGV